MPLPPDYKQISSIGEGYFCTVSRYHSAVAKQDYAVKRLKPEHHQNGDYRTRFLREITLLKELSGHPNIVDLVAHEPNEAEPHLWYTMPLAKENLYRFIKRENQNLAREDRIYLFEGILASIVHAHSSSILHRDIAPNNVLIFEEEDGLCCKLSDFGLGKDTEAIAFTRTSVGGYGQILYVSPEQRDHLKEADERSDIYSLGKLLYFIMTGKDPQDIRTGDFYPVIRRATQERPEERYQTISDLEKEFTSMKAFLLAPGKPAAEQTMEEYLEGKQTIDWAEFHQVALAAKEDTHTYSDYVGPVTHILMEKGNLEAYYAALGWDFLHFVEKYNEAVSSLSRQTHWPFKALDDFGYLNYRIFLMSDKNDVKLNCLKQIWEIAWDANQFAVQRHFRDLQSDNKIPEAIVSDFAQFVIHNGGRTKSSIEPYLGRNTPPLIKRAIQSLVKTED